MRKSVLVPIVLALIAVSCLLVPARPAAAAVTCSGSQCDYQSPTQTGCSSDAFTAESAKLVDDNTNIVWGSVQLRYSPTCRTVWAKVFSDVTIGGDVTAYAEVDRNDGGLQGCHVQQNHSNCETNMLYDHSDTKIVTSVAWGDVDIPPAPVIYAGGQTAPY
jgi:hypothetical protein